MIRYFFFDTETTDLIRNTLLPIDQQPHIIEFFGHTYQVRHGEDPFKVGELEFLCTPGAPITEEVTRITGIKPSDVEGKPPFSAYASDVISAIHSADVIVAHNLSYDMAVVDFELQRIGKRVLWPSQRICTVEQTEWIRGHRLNLGALYEHCFSKPMANAHRARDDVNAMTEAFFHLMGEGML